MVAYSVTDLMAYFGGQWGIRRDIVNDTGREIGRFVGSADFQPDADRLVYHEHGVLKLEAHRGPAHRTLHYQITGSGLADVYFGYGDFFHNLDLRTGWWRARHPCRDDVYLGEYEVLGPDQWRQEWMVRGPAKNHTLTTVFDRVA